LKNDPWVTTNLGIAAHLSQVLQMTPLPHYIYQKSRRRLAGPVNKLVNEFRRLEGHVGRHKLHVNPQKMIVK